jgi:tRNA (pseudouridine54-N1)-methyltransferase
VRTDERTWEDILRKVLSGGVHQGIELRRESFQKVLKTKNNIFILEEGGEDVLNVKLGENPIFVLGDQVGLPRKDEKFALRFGTKISLGKKPYLAASCVDIINYILDSRAKRE